MTRDPGALINLYHKAGQTESKLNNFNDSTLHSGVILFAQFVVFMTRLTSKNILKYLFTADEHKFKHQKASFQHLSDRSLYDYVLQLYN